MKRIVFLSLFVVLMVAMVSEAGAAYSVGWNKVIVPKTGSGGSGVASDNAYLTQVQVDLTGTPPPSTITLGDITISAHQDGAPANVYYVQFALVLPPGSTSSPVTLTPGLEFSAVPYGALGVGDVGDAHFVWTTSVSGAPSNFVGRATLDFYGLDAIPFYNFVDVTFPFTIDGNGYSPTERLLAPVPIPSALFLLAPGLVGLAAVRRRVKR